MPKDAERGKKMNFRDMDKKDLAEISSKGGYAKAEANKIAESECDGMDFEQIVNRYTTGKDLKDLYDGLMRSGKKGSVKATETILKYLEKKKEDDRNEFAL